MHATTRIPTIKHAVDSGRQVPATPGRDESLRHLTQQELARRWRISPRTLERWRWLSQGPAYLKLGGSVAYRLEDVFAHEETHRRTTQAQAEQALTKPARFARGLPG